MSYAKAPSSEAPRTAEAPPSSGTLGTQPWGNAAFAEDVLGAGAVEAQGAGQGDSAPLAVFRAEIAKPAPDPGVVYRALKDMAPAHRFHVYEDADTWAIVARVLPLEQLAELVPAMHEQREQVALEDGGVQAAIAELHPVLEAQLVDVVRMELEEMFAHLDQVEEGMHYAKVGMRETGFATFEERAARIFGRPGVTVELSAFDVGLRVTAVSRGMLPSITASVDSQLSGHMNLQSSAFPSVAWYEAYCIPSFTARYAMGSVFGEPGAVKWLGQK
ncbi:MAG: hypothetical protein R3F59_27000 [Myxococcota bacterium]